MRIPAIIIFLTILIQTIIDIYIWFDFYKTYKIPLKKSLIYFFILESCILLFLIPILLPYRDATSNLEMIMWLLYTYLTTLFPKIIYAIFSLIGRIPILFKFKNLRLGIYIGIPCATIIFICMWWGSLISRNEIDVKHVDLYSEKIPHNFDNYRIVQFSDIHLGTFGNDISFVSEVVDSINSLNPDIIFFTGDIVNRDSKEIIPFLNVLGNLKAKHGVYSILGNHDYGDYMNWENPEAKKQNMDLMIEYQSSIMNWNLLKNDFKIIKNGNDSIVVIGVENWGEPPFKQYGDLNTAYPLDSLHNLFDNNFKILLSHNPKHWRHEVVKKSNIDLTLSGHTHAMQFMLKFGDWQWSPSKWKYEEWAGLYNKTNSNNENMHLYVNIGIGEVAIPFRLGAKPEITFLTLKKVYRNE